MGVFVNVEGNKDMARDTHSSAIIHRNCSAYETAKRRVKQALNKRDEIRGSTR